MVKRNNKTRKISKRVLQMWNDPETVWGKNPELEYFWADLASGKKVVLIYKDKTHKYVNLPNRTTKKYKSTLNEFQEDTNIIAILSSNPSQDAYEQYLYPKAKSKSVDYVIQHYNTYFKPILPGDKLRVPL
jgi:ABC-type bacteriocin/lantibiotic exporter with double-glycine peptidase domain